MTDLHPTITSLEHKPGRLELLDEWREAVRQRDVARTTKEEYSALTVQAAEDEAAAEKHVTDAVERLGFDPLTVIRSEPPATANGFHPKPLSLKGELVDLTKVTRPKRGVDRLPPPPKGKRARALMKAMPGTVRQLAERTGAPITATGTYLLQLTQKHPDWITRRNEPRALQHGSKKTHHGNHRQGGGLKVYVYHAREGWEER